MPRTFVPEEQKRVSDLTALKNDIRPTSERVVTVESDADGVPNKFYWDQGADAANADGVSDIESNISLYADGGGEEGLWRRIIEPITSQTATTDDLTEGDNNLYFTEDRVKGDLSAGGDITYTPNTGQDGTPAEFSLDVSSLSAADLFGNKTTDDLPEGSKNQYYTDERAQDAVGTILGSQFVYTDGTPEITLDQGSGSGLNADQLDGFEESAFAKLADNETVTGDYTFDGSTAIGTNGSLALNNNKITGVGDPTNPKDAANKEYVDAIEQALDLKDSVRAASTGNIDLASSTDPNPIDGVTLSDGDRILLKDQNTASENGIYVAQTATDPSTWTRSADADEDVEVTAGLYTFIEEGTNNADNGFVLTTNDPITVGTTDLAFTQFSGAGQVIAGDGISKSGNRLDIVVGDIAGTGLKQDSSNPPNITVEPDDFAGSGLEDDGSDNLQLVNNSVTVTAGDGLKNGGTVALGGTTTIDIEPVDFAGNGLVDDGADDLEIDIGVADGGSDVTTSTSVYDLNFGDSLTVTDNTGTTAGRVTVDVDAANSTSIDVDDGGSDVATGVNNLNFGTNISATDDGNGKVTINGQSNAELQDAVFTTGNILSGTEDRITVSYDDANNELDFTVENDLSNYSFSNVSTDDISEGNSNLYYTDDRVKNSLSAGGDITYTANTGQNGTPAEFSLDVSSLSAADLFGSKTTDKLPEGSSNLYYTRERTEDDVNALLTAGSNINLTYTDNGTSAGDLTIDVNAAGSTSIDIDDGGSDVATGVNNIDFGTELAVTDNGGRSVTVDFDAVAIDEMGQETFSGDGDTEQFTISHSLGSTPNSWMVHPTTDDGSSPSHTTADSSQLTVIYDTPPPSGTNNLTLNYIIQG
jgi:hypothetical protein